MEKKRQPTQRARCPCFKACTDYKGKSYIHCGGKNYRYQDSNARESQYHAYCCGSFESCELYKENGGMNHDHAGSR